MTTLPLTTIIVARQVMERELGSALPHAPVVPDHPAAAAAPGRAVLHRTRLRTATVLQRAAARIAPA